MFRPLKKMPGVRETIANARHLFFRAHLDRIKPRDSPPYGR